MKKHFTMNDKEINRTPIMEKLIKKAIKQKRAAQILGLSVRQIKRLKKKYKLQGPKGLIHKNRGKPSNHKIPDKEVNQMINIVKKEYWDFGPTLAWEKLTSDHHLSFSVETLRKAMIEDGIWKPKKQRKPQVHQMRERRGQRGELVQIDGSPHAWFEERAPRCCLLVFIDDATSELLWLQFFESETTHAYFQSVYGYLRKDGKPLALYSDKNGIFRINQTKGGKSSLEDSQGLTHFGKAMEALGIELIAANTAQAKGRVEKANLTLQDRLVKELRLRKINRIKEANKYLPWFMKEFNQKFSVVPKNPKDSHRPLSPTENLEAILVKKHQRILSNNLGLQYLNKSYQIQTKRPTYSMRRARVTVAENRFGKIKIYYQGKHPKAKELKYTIITKHPKSEIINSKLLNVKIDYLKRKQCLLTQSLNQKPKHRPAANHPWRQYAHKI